MKGLYNALTFDSGIIKCAGSKNCARINYVGTEKIDGTEAFVPIEHYTGKGNIYIASLYDDALVDKAIEYASSGARVMLACCKTLDEVGTCDKKYGATPIGLAHKLGLLDGALLSGAVHLDKDDIDLIIQSGAEVVLTPSTSMGSGHGIPPLRMLLSLGATVRLGTGEARYNKEADLEFEAKLIALAVSGALCTKDAVAESEIKKILV